MTKKAVWSHVQNFFCYFLLLSYGHISYTVSTFKKILREESNVSRSSSPFNHILIFPSILYTSNHLHPMTYSVGLIVLMTFSFLNQNVQSQYNLPLPLLYWEHEMPLVCQDISQGYHQMYPRLLFPQERMPSWQGCSLPCPMLWTKGYKICQFTIAVNFFGSLHLQAMWWWILQSTSQLEWRLKRLQC